MEDKDGYWKIRNYVLKILSNVYSFSNFHYKKRERYSILSKIAKRREIRSMLESMYPLYCVRLLQWEKDMMYKHNIQYEELPSEDMMYTSNINEA